MLKYEITNCLKRLQEYTTRNTVCSQYENVQRKLEIKEQNVLEEDQDQM